MVDDVEDSAHTLAAVVRHLGHQVETAFGGFQALAAVETFRPDFVLLDLAMPNINGYEVCVAIKRQPRTKHIRVIAVSAFDQTRDRLRSASVGFEQHLAKPIDPDELEKLLKS